MGKFEAPVRSHLKNVYATLTMSIMAASAGAYVHLFTDILKGGGLIFSLLGAGIAFGLFMTPDNGKNRGTRLSMLMAFAFLTGLSTLLVLGFLNIFFRSQLLFQAHLYIGLAIFCGFIMFDTQVIIRKARNGDKDFIAHSLDLFIDFVQIFRKVLILLMQKDERDNKNKRR